MKPEDIVFSGVGKTHAELLQGLDEGIGQFNIESEEEGYELSAIAARQGKRGPSQAPVEAGRRRGYCCYRASYVGGNGCGAAAIKKPPDTFVAGGFVLGGFLKSRLLSAGLSAAGDFP